MRTNFLSGTLANSGKNPTDFRLFTRSGLFARKSPIQNKSQTACAVCAMKTSPISVAKKGSIVNFFRAITVKIFDSDLAKKKKKVCEFSQICAENIICFRSPTLRSVLFSGTISLFEELLARLAQTKVDIVEFPA